MKKRIFLFLIALVLTSLACTLSLGGPEPTAEPISYDPNAATELKDGIARAFAEGAATGVVWFQITEQQLTSVLMEKLVPAADGTPPFLTNPQAYLRDGKVEIYGLAQQSGFTANVRIAVIAGVTPEGKLDIKVDSVDFGPLPAPEGLNATIENLVTEAFTGAIGPVATGFRMEMIAIDKGTMVIQGRIK